MPLYLKDLTPPSLVETTAVTVRDRLQLIV